MEWDEVTDVGVLELARAMEKVRWAALEELSLESTKISAVGLQSLARAWSKGAVPKLRTLFLDGNEVRHARR